MQPCPQKPKGSALLTALLITMIVAALSMALLSSTHALIHTAMHNRSTDQDRLYLIGLRDQAMDDITQYSKAWQKPKANIALTLPAHIGPQSFNGVSLYATLKDQQARLNLNSLTNTANQWRFSALLHYVAPEITHEHAMNIANNLTQWLSPNTPNDPRYTQASPPYRAAHQALQAISELHWIAGITPSLYHHLQPYITALPTHSALININTAMPALLLTLSQKITPGMANALYECRKKHGVFLTITAYNQACVQPLHLPALTNITTNSQFFTVQASATYKTQHVFLSSLIMANVDKTHHVTTRIILQHHGRP